MAMVKSLNFFLLMLLLLSVIITLVASSPLTLVGVFLMLSILASFFSYINVTDFLVILMFLVYAGGLLVLLIYSTMLSSNYLMHFSGMFVWNFFLIIALSLGFSSYFYGAEFVFSMKDLNSTGSILFSSWGLISAAIFLFFIFFFVCNLVCLGGRSLDISDTT